jgi:hypothetical protein
MRPRRIVVVVVGAWLAVTACVTMIRRPFVGALPPDTHVDMAGQFTFVADGELRLELATACLRGHGTVEVACPREVLDGIKLSARTPWKQDIPGTWIDASHIAFKIDWKTSSLDLLADDAAALAAGPWEVCGTQWMPTADEAATIMSKVSAATETETTVVHGGPPPVLDVAFEVEGGAFHAGEPATLVVRITNRGAGTAYRVAATLRSSIETLHGRRLSFGAIKPGADKSRKLTLSVAAEETARDTMLVLAVSEGNGVAPSNVNRRIPIAPSRAAPILGVQCTMGGNKTARVALDAGQRVTLRCTVDNTGNADARAVELEVSVAGEPPTRSKPQWIAKSGHLMFDVPFDVPRTLPINAQVPIAITVRDHPSSVTATTTMVGLVRKPRLCVPGALTRAEYRARVQELQAQLAAKRLTQSEYDGYEAELVACLK